ncbi:hypothetical protein KIN20_014918 [Parelaphostrongylus tenuis]|uniref:Uncharacterized protein n=1 Tax=Parelaphostrongylus tenuis TaxID=148309 RepID=A0AAD5QPL3_PARTN|nr:hypothetical protein KIN20_014918 [Parelaphostrongylus tenuis]
MVVTVGSAATMEVARGVGSTRASKGLKPKAPSRLIELVCRNGKTQSSSEYERMELLPHSSSITGSLFPTHQITSNGGPTPLLYGALVDCPHTGRQLTQAIV